MKNLSIGTLILLAFVAAGCASSPPPQSDPRAAEFKSSVSPPPGLARVYLLPTYSKGLFQDLEGKASFVIFPENSERGARLGTTTKSSFVAFDISPGDYDILALGDDPLTRVTTPMAFDGGKSYFLRPSFFRSAKEISGSRPEATGGMGFDQVKETAAAAEIARLDMAALNPEGDAFIKKTLASQASPARPPTVVPTPRMAGSPPPAALPAAPVPTPAPAQAATATTPDTIPAPMQTTSPATSIGSDSFAVIERKLRELKQLRQEGLITKQEYEGKRREILNAY